MTEHVVRCLISAGPTREHLDPVRYISNPSSGKMGVSLAAAAVRAGWKVSLVVGPCEVPLPEGLEETVRVTSSDEMYSALSERFDSADILIMSAAVSDMKPQSYVPHKVKKADIDFCVHFVPTVDILKTLSKRKAQGQFLVGFAAETDDVLNYAKKKLAEKNLDVVAANKVCGKRGGFGDSSNEMTLIFKDSDVKFLEYAKKDYIAEKMIGIFSEKFFHKKI